jgi:triosephosphate isomerase
MRTPIVAGNWKMNTTLEEARALVDALKPELEALEGVERVVCPPFISLAAVADRLRGSSILVGAQNVYVEPSGAFTGEISPPMLQGLVDYVIIGHSERRQLFGDTDELVHRKIRAALAHGLKPILCVGENLEQNEAGQTEEVVGRQVKKALEGIEDAAGLVIAYEPIWAIGTGRAASPEDANRVIAFIRAVADDLQGTQQATAMRIQYGGSVTPDNFPGFIAQPDVDGALVGGASLKAPLFAEICRQAAQAKGSADGGNR